MTENPVSRYSDTTISVLAAAPIAEARFGNILLGRKHCNAPLHLLNCHGGPRALQNMTSIAGTATRIVVSFVSIGAGHTIFSDYVKLLASLRCLKETLMAIQAWSRSFFLNDAIFRGSLTKNDDASTYCKLYHNTKRYHMARAKVFACDSRLHRFIVPAFKDDNLIEQRCHVAILAILVKVLFDLRHETEQSARFVDEMAFAVESGIIVPEANETQPPQMRALTVLYIAIDCAARYESIGVNTRCGVLRSWQAVEVLELAQLAGPRGRLRIAELLSCSLTGEYDKNANYLVSDEEMTAICDEMRLAWMRDNGRGDTK